MNLTGKEDHYGEEVDEEAAEYLYQRQDQPASAFDWDTILVSSNNNKNNKNNKGGRGGGGGGGPSTGRKKNRGKKKKNATPKVDPLIELRAKEVEEIRNAYPSLKVVAGEESKALPTYDLTIDISFAHIKGDKSKNKRGDDENENEKGKGKEKERAKEALLTILFAHTDAYPYGLPVFSVHSTFDARHQLNYGTLYELLEEQSMKFMDTRGTTPFLMSLIRMTKDWFEFNITAAIKDKKKQKQKRREERRLASLPPVVSRDKEQLYEFFRSLRLKLAPLSHDAEPVENKQEQLLKEAQQIEEEDYDDFDLTQNRIRFLPKVVLRLSDICIHNIAENLFLYESLEEMPGSIKELIFTFLIKYYKLHPKHLALLLDKDLRNLDLSSQSSYITDKHLVYVKNCSRLKVLNIKDCNKITDPVLTTISGHCHAITHLILESCSLLTDDATLALADGCPNLIELNMNFCSKLKGEGIKKFARRCNQLQILRIAGLPLVPQETVLYVVQQVWSLLYLDASHSGDKILEEIHPLSRLRSVNLQSLFLHSSKHATNSFINVLFAFGFPRLKRLGLSNCSMLSETTIQWAISRAPYLESIDVSGCGVGSNWATKFVDVGRSLTKLDISGSSIKMATSSALELIKKCSSLRTLLVCDTLNISGLGVLKAAMTHPNLEDVDVSGTKDEIGGIIILPSPLSKKMRTITANRCAWLVDYYAIELLAKGYPSLSTLSIQSTPITDDGLLAILRGCVELRNLDITNSTIYMRRGLLDDLGQQGGKNLRSFTIKGMTCNSSNCLYDLPRAFPSISSLELDPANVSTVITDEILISLSKYAENLRRLVLGPARNVSEIGIGSLFTECLSLKMLILYGSHLRSRTESPTVFGMRRNIRIIFKEADYNSNTYTTNKGTWGNEPSDDDDLDIMDLFA